MSAAARPLFHGQGHRRRLRSGLTALLAGLLVGSASPVLAGTGDSFPEELSVAGDRLYFWARSPGRGIELWRTDGTTAGTRLFHEFQDGTAGGEGGRVQLRDGLLWVIADNGVKGHEPWVIDPDTGSGRLLKDIMPGAQGSGSDGNDAPFVKVGGRVLFPADDGTHGREWWSSTGTRASTQLVEDVNEDESWFPSDRALIDGVLVFSAWKDLTEVDLWRTGGTAATTESLDLVSATSLSDRGRMHGYVYFGGFTEPYGGELWRTDGTTAEQVKDIHPDAAYGSPNGFVRLGNRMLFQATDGDGVELWSTEGTGPSTVQVRDIHPSGDSYPQDLVRLGDLVLFSAEEPSKGRELWRTDGVTASRVKDIRVGPNPSHPSDLVVSGGRLFFIAVDGQGGGLWVSDGSKTGTRLLKRFQDEFGYLTAYKGGIVFTASDGVHGYEPWISDGTKAGTRMLKDIR